MATKNEFQLPILWRSKNFSHQPCSDQKFLVTNPVTIKMFLVALLCDDQNFLVPKEGVCVLCFWKAFDEGFPKTYDMLPFLATKNVWSPFDMGVCWMATKFFQSPSNTPSPSDGK